MSATFVVPELTTTDFTSDFDELLRQYIYNEYALTDPLKTGATIKFKVGFFDYKVPYEIAVIETDTDIPQYPNGRRRAYTSTGMEVHVRAKRMARSETQIPEQLGIMEREIIRIIMQYRSQEIPGIKDVVWAGSLRIYSPTDTWATSDWHSAVRCRMFYEKSDIS